MPSTDKDKKIIDLVFGTRPNIIKAAGLYAAWQENAGDWPFHLRLVDTGQHWDDTLSQNQRLALGLPEPACNLGIGKVLAGQNRNSVDNGATNSDWRETVISAAAHAYERLVKTAPPTASIAIGDVNGSVGITRAAARQGVSLFHLEAGLRGGSDAIAEEANRRELDHICQYLWAPDDTALANLVAEGISTDRIAVTGNIMIDTLVRWAPLAPATATADGADAVAGGQHPILVTIHRAENLAPLGRFRDILSGISAIAQDHPVTWPQHPRTRQQIEKTDWAKQTPGNICLLPALTYPDFMAQLHQAKLVITDSGGILEECAYLGKRTVILRPRTERPHAMAHCGFLHATPHDLPQQTAQALQNTPSPFRPAGWDGNAAIRMLEDITSRLF
ncbi:UDP-N-acetyl glucosamine 2-epimerase [Thalassospira marina]|nr:UDP-N-acetylglucosamine 2-epimerase [Thalassospira marina]